uniref:Uncharacterized protein n=1 Tax=Anguilla anguilla TaxID=7936 RepID=A0A0E9TJD5_ANGAN
MYRGDTLAAPTGQMNSHCTVGCDVQRRHSGPRCALENGTGE